jgi:serine/threonine-protein kinase HipA
MKKTVHRRGNVFVHQQLAGAIWQNEEGFHFAYTPDYVAQQPPAPPVSLTLPVQTVPYYSRTELFPFFDNLIPEGWLLDLATGIWKVSPYDRMGLLLTVCRDCIGAVHVEAVDITEPAE